MDVLDGQSVLGLRRVYTLIGFVLSQQLYVPCLAPSSVEYLRGSAIKLIVIFWVVFSGVHPTHTVIGLGIAISGVLFGVVLSMGATCILSYDEEISIPTQPLYLSFMPLFLRQQFFVLILIAAAVLTSPPPDTHLWGGAYCQERHFVSLAPICVGLIASSVVRPPTWKAYECFEAVWHSATRAGLVITLVYAIVDIGMRSTICKASTMGARGASDTPRLRHGYFAYFGWEAVATLVVLLLVSIVQMCLFVRRRTHRPRRTSDSTRTSAHSPPPRTVLGALQTMRS